MKKLLLLIIPLLSSLLLQAATLEEGRLKLVVDDSNGGFQLYSRPTDNDQWKAMIGESYTASYFSIYVDGQWVNPVLDPSVSRGVESDGLSITIRFDETRFTYVIKMELVAQGNAARQNYLRMKGTLYNKKSGTLKMGLRFLLDSRFILQKEHFYINGNSISTERAFDEIPAFIENRGAADNEHLYILSGTEGISPDRLVLANWYRLDQSTDAEFIYRQGRSFDALPYSLNDAGAAYYWDAVDLGRNSSLNISLMMGLDEPVENDSAMATVLTESDRVLRQAMVESHLEYIDEFLNELTYIEQSGQNLSENDILVLQRKLEILKSKRSEYEDIQ